MVIHAPNAASVELAASTVGAPTAELSQRTATNRPRNLLEP
ncbi:hypothetical protein D779_3386 [Imhoffiella purpurea]|uniref:Uncharacterized protein n=1 Tax=Imhoffiella purpurea TaxID=1249627 RepID=W9VB88_9GAMM|nr:hypothetical protein D779_3386 [Imhoffiella purpurea]